MKKIYGLLAVLLISGCAAEKVQTDLPVENLYNNAFDDLQKTKYKKAAEEFEQVEIEHPYSQWAVKAKLMGAYAYYKNEDYELNQGTSGCFCPGSDMGDHGNRCLSYFPYSGRSRPYC